MNIQEVQIGKIKPDPNQPRRSHPKADVIKEMAESISREGLINPIEIDKNGLIVTGSLRYEAAKLAGLETVPCKVVNFSNNDARFVHQLTENIHQNSMDDLDISEALNKLILHIPDKIKTGSGGHNDKGITVLAKALGKSTAYISEKLGLKGQSEEFKQAIAEGKIASSYARVLNNTPENFKEDMEAKLLSGEFKTRGCAEIVASVLRNRPDQGAEVMNADFNNLDIRGVHKTIKKIIPDYSETPVSDQVAANLDVGRLIPEAAIKLTAELRAHSAEDLPPVSVSSAILQLRATLRAIYTWLGQPDPELQVEDRRLIESEDEQEETEEKETYEE